MVGWKKIDRDFPAIYCWTADEASEERFYVSYGESVESSPKAGETLATAIAVCVFHKFIVMGKPQFIAEEVEVREAGPGEPVSFLWRGQEYRIVEVVGVKRHLDFRRPWWQRRHRDYYRVRTDTGQTFELYFHRGPGRKYWVLYKEAGE